MKQYDKYKPSDIKWLGDIPSHWGRLRMKDIGFLYGGLSGKSGDDFGQDENEHNKPFIPFTNIFNNDIIDPYKMGVVVIFDNEQQNKVQKNDLFFLMSSEDYDGLGKCSLLKVDLEDTYLNSFCKGFRLTSGKVLPEFLNKLLLSHKYKIILQNEGKGFTRMNLKTDRISGFQFFLPPIPEQTAIAAYLDERTANIDRRIELLRNKIEHYKQLRRSLISQVVLRGLNPNVKLKPSGIDWLGDIPEHWEVKRVKDLAFLQSGDNLTSEDIDSEGLFPVYGGNGLRGYYDNYNVEGFFALIGRQGALCGNINYGNGKFWATDHAVVCYNKHNVNTKWFGELLRTMNLNQYSMSSAQPGLSVDRIKVLGLPFPPLDEQTDIAAYLDEKTSQIDTIVSNCEKQIEQLTELRRSLISQAVTGQIKVC